MQCQGYDDARQLLRYLLLSYSYFVSIGVGEYLKSKNRDIKVVLADPQVLTLSCLDVF